MNVCWEHIVLQNRVVKKIIGKKATFALPLYSYELRKKNINVSRATVYRTIDVLVKNNLVRKIDLGDNPAKFERQTEHHNHIVCVNCGSIEEYFDKIIEQRQIKIIEELGFKMIRHTQNLFVLCKNCL